MFSSAIVRSNSEDCKEVCLQLSLSSWIAFVRGMRLLPCRAPGFARYAGWLSTSRKPGAPHPQSNIVLHVERRNRRFQTPVRPIAPESRSRPTARIQTGAGHAGRGVARWISAAMQPKRSVAGLGGLAPVALLCTACLAAWSSADTRIREAWEGAALLVNVAGTSQCNKIACADARRCRYREASGPARSSYRDPHDGSRQAAIPPGL